MGETQLRLGLGEAIKLEALIADEAGASFGVGGRLELTCQNDTLHIFDEATGASLR